MGVFWQLTLTIKIIIFLLTFLRAFRNHILRCTRCLSMSRLLCKMCSLHLCWCFGHVKEFVYILWTCLSWKSAQLKTCSTPFTVIHNSDFSLLLSVNELAMYVVHWRFLTRTWNQRRIVKVWIWVYIQRNKGESTNIGVKLLKNCCKLNLLFNLIDINLFMFRLEYSNFIKFKLCVS